MSLSLLLIAFEFLSNHPIYIISQTIEAKGTPPGLMKTPGVVATQKAVEKETREVGKPNGKHENYKGTITAVDAGSITLALKDGTTITIALTVETRIHIPTVKEVAADGLATGMIAMVQAIRGKDDSLTASKVVLAPGKPAKTHNVGTVTAYAVGSSITIQAKDGQLYIYSLTEETKILPVERLDLLIVGARVTIIAPRDVSTLNQTANGIAIHPPVVEE